MPKFIVETCRGLAGTQDTLVIEADSDAEAEQIALDRLYEEISVFVREPEEGEDLDEYEEG